MVLPVNAAHVDIDPEQGMPLLTAKNLAILDAPAPPMNPGATAFAGAAVPPQPNMMIPAGIGAAAVLKHKKSVPSAEPNDASAIDISHHEESQKPMTKQSSTLAAAQPPTNIDPQVMAAYPPGSYPIYGQPGVPPFAHPAGIVPPPPGAVMYPPGVVLPPGAVHPGYGGPPRPPSKKMLQQMRKQRQKEEVVMQSVFEHGADPQEFIAESIPQTTSEGSSADLLKKGPMAAMSKLLNKPSYVCPWFCIRS